MMTAAALGVALVVAQAVLLAALLGVAPAVPLGVAPAVDVSLAVPPRCQSEKQLTRTSTSLLGHPEVHEDMLVPHRFVLLSPLRRANSVHHVQLEDETMAQLLVSLMLPSMLASRSLAHLHGA